MIVQAHARAARTGETEALDLEGIRAPGVTTLWIRRRDLAVEPGLGALVSQLGPSQRAATVVASDPAPGVDALLEGLPAGATTDWLRRDVAALARAFGAALGRRHVHARLSIVSDDACRRFHQDYGGIRLLCTYSGPGTELVPEESVDRRFLAAPDLDIEAANALVVRPADVVRARALDVVVLRGALDGRAGAVHRSPPIEALGLRRLVLKLDEHPCGC